MRRINPYPGHAIAEQDDSGITSVLVCRCGDSFLGIGTNRMQEVRWEHAQHAYTASLWGEGHGFRAVPDIADYRAPGGGVRRSRKREAHYDNVVAMYRAGEESLAALAAAVGITQGTVKAWLIEAGEIAA